MYEKFGKPANDVLEIKEGFFLENDKYLKYQEKINNIYCKQEIRKNCKVCNKKLVKEDMKSFMSHGLRYMICSNCNHLNGEFEETKVYSEEVYNQTEYDTFYIDKDLKKYNSRVCKIYKPKLKFLQETLEKSIINSSSILDVGAGVGYFCKACEMEGIYIKGIEISDKQIEYGREMLKEDSLIKVEPEESIKYIEQSEANIVTMFGVLESVYNLHDVMYALSKNSNIEYFYFSIPMFSLSCILESINPESFNRNLGGAHTHLFTDSSIEYLLKENNFEIISRWKFGSDIIDMFRFIGNKLKWKGENELYDIYSHEFVKIIDELQVVVDKSGFGSESHIVARKITK